MTYVTRELVDDHWPGRLIKEVLGVYVLPGALPVLVACGEVGRKPRGLISINQVACIEGCIDGNPHRPHLTRTSVTVLNEREHARLLDVGFLDFPRPGAFIVLLVEQNTKGNGLCAPCQQGDHDLCFECACESEVHRGRESSSPEGR